MRKSTGGERGIMGAYRESVDVYFSMYMARKYGYEKPIRNGL
jgi:hypothetical protein